MSALYITLSDITPSRATVRYIGPALQTATDAQIGGAQRVLAYVPRPGVAAPVVGERIWLDSHYLAAVQPAEVSS